MRILVVGSPQEFQVGSHLAGGAKDAGHDARVVDTAPAYGGHSVLRKTAWHLLGKRPLRLAWFGNLVVNTCDEWAPELVLVSGMAPVGRVALEAIRKRGIAIVDYLTDDPWNPAHRAGWFFRAIPAFDAVFTTRRANLEDLRRAGVQRVAYLPFGFAPAVHYPEADREGALQVDVYFGGTGDADRVPIISALVRGGLSVELYGTYWDAYRATRGLSRGQADIGTLRRATGRAKVSLCLVRRANRDGHSMRSFEVPACGGVPLVEDTVEHREIFGPEGQAALYFRSTEEMIGKARTLVEDGSLREAIRTNARRLIASGGHQYADRVRTIVEAVCR